MKTSKEKFQRTKVPFKSNLETMRPSLRHFLTQHHKSLLLPWLLLTIFILLDLLKTWHFQGLGHGQVLVRELLFVFLAYYSWLLVAIGLGYQLSQQLSRPIKWRRHLLYGLLAGLLHILLVCALLWVINPEKVANALFHLVYLELFYRWIAVELVLYFACLAYWQWQLSKSAATELLIKTNNGHLACQPEYLMWTQSAGNYLHFKYKDHTHKVRMTLKEMMALFTPHLFQIHRSTAINLKYFEQINEQRVLMQDGSKLPISQNRKKALLSAMQNNFDPNIG